MQCDNCQRAAIYIYAPRMITPAHYCERHLPAFLKKQTKSGVLQTTDAYDEIRSQVMAKLAPTPEVPSPAAEEEPVTEAVDETPAEEKPKRRRRPRKAATPSEETKES